MGGRPTIGRTMKGRDVIIAVLIGAVLAAGLHSRHAHRGSQTSVISVPPLSATEARAKLHSLTRQSAYAPGPASSQQTNPGKQPAQGAPLGVSGPRPSAPASADWLIVVAFIAAIGMSICTITLT